MTPAPINCVEWLRELAARHPEYTDAPAVADAVAELFAAIAESRSATQAFANDGGPASWVRYLKSEGRLNAALTATGGTP